MADSKSLPSDGEDEFDDEPRASSSKGNVSSNVRPIFSKVPVPNMMPDNVETWFIQLESWFALNKIVSDGTKFNTVVAYVDGKMLTQVYGIVSNPPACNKFQALKDAIMANFGDTEQRRFQKLISGMQLGDKRPSHLLNELRKVGGRVDEQLLKSLWMQRLPSQAKSIVAAAKGSLTELAEVADAVCESLDLQSIGSIDAPKAVFQSNEPQSSTVASLQQQINQLTNRMNQLNNNRNRSRSRSRNQPNKANNDDNKAQRQNQSNQQTTCWYHRTFGTGATKCRSPCDFQVAGTAITKN